MKVKMEVEVKLKVQIQEKLKIKNVSWCKSKYNETKFVHTSSKRAFQWYQDNNFKTYSLRDAKKRNKRNTISLYVMLINTHGDRSFSK